MAASYGYDISRPAATAREAVQWLYFGYLAAVKEQNGAAMSLGRTSTFLDVYLERDLAEGALDEAAAQELIDDFVIKLRIVRFLRTPEYDELFSGDPTWVTEAIGGIGADGRPLVTRTSFRFLQTLYNLGPGPGAQPDRAVVAARCPRASSGSAPRCRWTPAPSSTSPTTCCAPRSATTPRSPAASRRCAVGKDMQFFGARVNLAKALLYAINGGRDEITGEQVAPPSTPIDRRRPRLRRGGRRRSTASLDWLADLTSTRSTSSTTCTTSTPTSAWRWRCTTTRCTGSWPAASPACRSRRTACRPSSTRECTVLRDETGLAVDYAVEGDYPAYGNNDDRADSHRRLAGRELHGRGCAGTRPTGTPSTRSRC